MKKHIKKVILLAFLLVASWVVYNSVVIGAAREGIVVDSVTKQPLSGIYLVRQTNVVEPGIEGTHERRLRIVVTVSDKDGRFSFPTFVRFKSPFDRLYRELLDVNYFGEYLDEEDAPLSLKYNPLYFEDTYGLGFSDASKISRAYKQSGHTYKPFNDESIINLTPIVSSFAECKGDSECIEKNEEWAKICKMVPFGQPGSDARCKGSLLK